MNGTIRYGKELAKTRYCEPSGEALARTLCVKSPSSPVFRFLLHQVNHEKATSCMHLLRRFAATEPTDRLPIVLDSTSCIANAAPTQRQHT